MLAKCWPSAGFQRGNGAACSDGMSSILLLEACINTVIAALRSLLTFLCCSAIGGRLLVPGALGACCNILFNRHDCKLNAKAPAKRQIASMNPRMLGHCLAGYTLGCAQRSSCAHRGPQLAMRIIQAHFLTLVQAIERTSVAGDRRWPAGWKVLIPLRTAQQQRVHLGM